METTLKLIGNKWKILILRELLTGTKRFGEIRNAIGSISQKVLTQNLRAMEQDGIIEREVFPEVPPKVKYRLSELGNSMKPIICAMQDWGINYLDRKKQ